MLNFIATWSRSRGVDLPATPPIPELRIRSVVDADGRRPDHAGIDIGTRPHLQRPIADNLNLGDVAMETAFRLLDVSGSNCRCA